MSTTNFDTPWPGLLVGEMAVAIIDPDGDPNTVLQTGNTWGFKVDWSLDGGFPPMFAGTWKVEAYLDPLTGNAGVPIAAGTASVNYIAWKPFPPGSTKREWTCTINPAVPMPDANAGAYKFVALVSFFDQFNNPVQMAGIQEGPLLRFFKYP